MKGVGSFLYDHPFPEQLRRALHAYFQQPGARRLSMARQEETLQLPDGDLTPDRQSRRGIIAGMRGRFPIGNL